MFASKAVMFGNVFGIQLIDMAKISVSWSAFEVELVIVGRIYK